MLAAHIPPAVFMAHETGDVHPAAVIAIHAFVAILVVITAGFCVFGTRDDPRPWELPRFLDPSDYDDDDDEDEDEEEEWWDGAEVTSVCPASPMFVPARQVRQ